MFEHLKFQSRLFLAVLWLLLTLSMAGWWMVFSLNLLEKLGSMDPQMASHRKMLIWEGAAWMLLLVGGGGYIVFTILRNQKQLDQVRQFVAAFSHDLKTSLASLRLQSESLKEDLSGRAEEKLADRLLSDAARLQVQLENSLILASGFKSPIFIEPVSLRASIQKVSEQWPGIRVSCDGEALLKVDANGFISILNNLIQNARVHGGADRVLIRVVRVDSQNISLEFEDSGCGFKGDFSQLGKLFVRHNPSSGSGVGLFIVRELIQQMNGQMECYNTSTKGFGVRLRIPGVIP